jgi:glycerophosphoryl diester phosphodiesterase
MLLLRGANSLPVRVTAPSSSLSAAVVDQNDAGVTTYPPTSHQRGESPNSDCIGVRTMIVRTTSGRSDTQSRASHRREYRNDGAPATLLTTSATSLTALHRLRLEQARSRIHGKSMLFGKDLSFFARVSSGVRALLRPNTYPGPARHPKLIAHRGDTRTAPENTRASCEAALEAGADGVELDVCVTRDGVAVLWHDIDPNARLAVYRQSGADNGRFVPRAPPPASTLRRPIHELTFSEVREHYGYIAAEGLLDRLRAAGEHKQIERLDEVVPWLSHTPLEPLFLDIKLRAADIESVGLVADELARLARTHPACFTRAVHVATPEREIFGALRWRRRFRRAPRPTTGEASCR